MSGVDEVLSRDLGNLIQKARDRADRDGNAGRMLTLDELIEAITPAVNNRIASASESKRQYGVQIVWADPVVAGAAKPGEVYEPKWMAFESIDQADRFAELYEPRINGLPEFGGVADVNRAERWAVEQYGEWTTPAAAIEERAK